MPEIQIRVRDKIAQVQGDPRIICGNSDYVAVFDFDEEWPWYAVKTARFEFWRRGLCLHHDVQIGSDNRAAIPALYDIGEVEVGVQSGTTKTTTRARIPCIPCITDNAPTHDDPTPDVYTQLLTSSKTMRSKQGFLSDSRQRR